MTYDPRKRLDFHRGEVDDGLADNTAGRDSPLIRALDNQHSDDTTQLARRRRHGFTANRKPAKSGTLQRPRNRWTALYALRLVRVDVST